MSMPKLQPARLGGVEGMGYAFSRTTHRNGAVRGIFYARAMPPEELEPMVDLEAVSFSGVLYRRSRSGSVQQRHVDVDVDVTRMTSVALGDRLDFIEAEVAD